MAPKTRSVDSPPVTRADSSDPNSQQSTLVPTPNTLALVLEQIALINARLDAHAANAAVAIATVGVPEPHVVQRLRDAQREPPRDDHSIDYATATWDTMCERLDSKSFARSLSLLDNLTLKQRPGQSLIDYVHFMRQTFYDYNETCQRIDGSAAIHPHNLGLIVLRGISSTGPFGEAKQCLINAFDTGYLLSADEVIDNILYLAHNMDEEITTPGALAPDTSPPPISAFVVDGRGSHSGRGHTPRGGRGLPNKCYACGSLDHFMSSCTAPDDALLKWALAKRKMIVQKYGTPCGSSYAHAALLSEFPADDADILPTLEDCKDEYDDTEEWVC